MTGLSESYIMYTLPAPLRFDRDVVVFISKPTQAAEQPLARACSVVKILKCANIPPMEMAEDIE